MPADLILASGSRYRRELLERLDIAFRVETGDVDETPQPGEAPATLATRLARAKAVAVAARHPASWVIGADQVAVIDGRIVGKPGNAERATAQLQAASGQTVTFFTAACLLRQEPAELVHHLDETRVSFRRLSAAEIARYLELERPFDCAGSFKSEGLGIALMERIESIDPTALVGLPLIWLSQALGRARLGPLTT
ncbi:MAG TPA: Maf family nucleotide pyrophosphatase [Steroidobacteraceae bacterium]|nr:Maf family nucleotide pyrophosphatase [Steroidobacteraceae bacterium]